MEGEAQAKIEIWFIADILLHFDTLDHNSVLEFLWDNAWSKATPIK